MPRGRTQRWAAVGLIICGTIVLACAAPASPEPVEPASGAGTSEEGAGVSLLQDRCSVHHSLSRVEQASKSRDGWQETVERMVGKGASLTEEEQAVVVDYLVDTYGS